VKPFSYSRYFALSVLVLALAGPGASAAITASVVTTDIFIVEEDSPIDEDVYVASTSGRVEGTIDGDLTILTGQLIITGTVTGSVMAMTSGTVRIAPEGVVEGSLRTVSPAVEIEGTVGGDALVTGAGLTIGDAGSVGGDVIVFGGAFATSGEIGRDIRGRLITAGIDGAVGGDVDIAVELLTIGPSAQIGGDVLYRSTNPASISSDADIAGQVVELPAQSNFFYGVLLALAAILTFLGFVVGGLAMLWLFRATGEAAVDAIENSPIKSLLIGIATVLGGVVVLVLLAGTLVGLPLAGLLLLAMGLGLIFGPVPSVAVFGDLLVRKRWGLLGGFVLGAVLWRFVIWVTSIAGIGAIGGLLYLIAHSWGIGGWVLGGWRVRAARDREREALPEGMVVEPDDLPEGWEYPLAPEGSAAVAARSTLDERAARVTDQPPSDEDED
jgi:cytoskeletal protein CcmA (bactofilin family)